MTRTIETNIANQLSRGEVLPPRPVKEGLGSVAISGMEWTAQARCKDADPEIFFPKQGESVTEAQRICRTCPVKGQCGQYALDNNEEFGIWGETTGSERMMPR